MSLCRKRKIDVFLFPLFQALFSVPSVQTSLTFRRLMSTIVDVPHR
jgi:hypothetical protein